MWFVLPQPAAVKNCSTVATYWYFVGSGMGKVSTLPFPVNYFAAVAASCVLAKAARRSTAQAIVQLLNTV